MHRIERTADTVFIIAMLVMTLICGFITYAMSISPKRDTSDRFVAGPLCRSVMAWKHGDKESWLDQKFPR